MTLKWSERFDTESLPVGGSSEHHCEQGHPAEGLCVQEL